ncbi:DNA-processing protein DprA [Limnobaculum xujianqingii]|uniref:DNA-processing protein DprA n=1 Tax=Limnobaculum xujianqingii TaxID=2738837 RepID=UPI0015BC3BDB|nr:DNA-processing protein DprA [Limnobaculum xujianqingii]
MNVISSNTKKILELSAITGVGAKTLNSLKNLPDFSAMTTKELINLVPSLDNKINKLSDLYDFAEKQISFGETLSHTIISQFDDVYPKNLMGLEDAPALLYCSGDVSILNKKCISVIGTREPTEHGKIFAKNISKWFVSNGWNIVSGLAKGIDTIAHESCLNSNAKTIAVLAHGLGSKVYPAENRGLAQKIIQDGGVLLSEYPYGSSIFKTNFVQRDRIQAGLSAAVFLIQSDISGGSLHASRAILKYKRPLVVTGQSSKDRKNNEPKIQANLGLLYGEDNDIRNILKLDHIDRNLILKMFTSKDYFSIEKLIENLAKKNDVNYSQQFDF